MEPAAQLMGLSALVLVVLAPVVLVGLFVSRQRTLSRRVGSFACLLGHHDTDRDSWGWSAGRAQYSSGGRLMWWRTLSLSPRPARTWSRSHLMLLDRIQTGERDETGSPMLEVRCRHRDEELRLRLSAAACAGLVSWLESAPGAVGRAV